MITENTLSKIRSLGQRQSQTFAYNWLEEQKEDLSSNEIVFSNDNRMLPGKIHTFKYDPKYKDKLDYYDRKPVVLSLGNLVRGNNILEMGINLNFVPHPYKSFMLDTIKKTYSGYFNSFDENKSPLIQPNIKYNYKALKAILGKYGFSYALRTYIPSRKSDLYVVNYSKWDMISLLSIEDFEGITESGLKAQFSRKLNS